MKCRVIGVRKQQNDWWVGKAVDRLELVQAGTKFGTRVKTDTGYKCVYETEVVFFHPDDLEVIDATH